MRPVPLPRAAILFALLTLQIPSIAVAQHNHAQMMAASTALQEPGQGTFAAVTEIVSMLRQDPNTDWSKVDVGALRGHLVDMSELMLISKVTEAPIKDGLRITIDLTKLENAAAGRMVPAHAPVLANETGWQSTVSSKEGKILWHVISASDAEVIRALGFYGLMATGDHHIAHHIGLARGNAAH